MGRPPCCDKANVKKGPWTAEEDAKLLAYTSTHGTGNWTSVPQRAGLKRCGKSCRLRYTNYLRPNLKHENFTAEEEERIVTLHAMLGSRWSLIANQLPGRTDNDVKNYWNTKLSKKLRQRGIDPITHRPISELMQSIGSLANRPSTSLSAPDNATRPRHRPLLSDRMPAMLDTCNPSSLAQSPPLDASSSSTVTAAMTEATGATTGPSCSPELKWRDFLADNVATCYDLAYDRFVHVDPNGAAASSHDQVLQVGAFGSSQNLEAGANVALEEVITSNINGDHGSSTTTSSSFIDAILDRDKEMASEFSELLVDPYYCSSQLGWDC